MKTIKKIAGDLLLFFYNLQRNSGFVAVDMLVFRRRNIIKNDVELVDSSELAKNMLKIADGSHADVYNALQYLYEGGFISFRASKDTMGESLLDVRVANIGGN